MGEEFSKFKDSDILWTIFLNKLIEKIDAIKALSINNNIIIVGCQNIILVSIKSSLAKLIDGGAEILIAKKINHQNVKFGKILIIPLIIIIFRVWNLVYTMFTSKNNADEANPWASIIIIAPFIPIKDSVKSAEITIAIWAMEEYAIKDFKSFCRIQFILVIIAPVILILIIQ